MPYRINDPVTEILAILLYQGTGGGKCAPDWNCIHAEEKENYRRIARGEEDAYVDEEEEDAPDDIFSGG